MSQIQTKFIQDAAVTDVKLATDAVTTPKIAAAAVTNVKLASGIDAVKIGDGSVSNTEFQRLNGLTGDIQSQLDAKVDDSEKGANNGVATLDAGGKIPVTQLPNSVMEFQGQWDASSNTPTLADGVGNAGDVYRVATSGTQDLGSGSIAYSIGDWVMYSGTIWQRAGNTSDVVSVNGQQGIVVLDTDDIAEGANLYYTDERAQDAVGNNVLDTASVNLTYNDGTGQISADVLPAGVDHDALLNFVANEHVDHSGVAIQTGVNSGLTGGGDITTSRSLVIDPNNAVLVTPAAGDLILIADVSDSNNLKKATAQSIADLFSGAGFATTELDNLGTTNINASLLFDTADTYDVGAPASALANVYTNFVKSPNSLGIETQGALEITTANDEIHLYASTVAPSLFFWDDTTSFAVAIKAPASLVADYTLTLPADDGAPSQFLQTNGSGVLSWASPADTGITELTGDVTAGPGSGSQVATIANLAVTTAKLDNLAVTNAKIANATIDLTTKVTGTLPVANGGTGASSLTANNVILGNGTSAVQFVAPGTSGNVLTSNGTTWASIAPLAWAREEFTLSAGDIVNGFIDTAFTSIPDSVIFVVSGLVSREGTDYTISGTTLDFSTHTPPLIAGDVVVVQYQH